MANRTITTTLKLNVTDFKANARGAATSLEDLVKTGNKMGQIASTYLGRMAQSLETQRESWEQLSNSTFGWGAVTTTVIDDVVATYARFDQAMSAVQASTHKSAASMDLLREAAIKAGADTQYNATEAAGAIEELAKAGISTADILRGGLDGTLSLAAAGGLDIAEAAGIASIALTQFKLSGRDMGHVADLLAAGADKAMGDVLDLGMALKQSGLVASQMGLTLEETTGALAAFASAGILGSEAGTSFKSMLQHLTPQSEEVQILMDKLGISAYDAQGNFIGLATFAGNLQSSLSNLTMEQRNSAIATIFGADAVRAASVIYDQGQEGIQGWIDAVNNIGYAAKTAAARMDNLLGDWEAFTSSLETLFLESSSGVNEILRSMVQGAEGLVDALADIPTPILEAGVSLIGFVGIGGLVVGGSMKMIGATYDTIRAWQELKHLAPRVSGSLGGVGKAAGIAGAALVGLSLIDMTIEHFAAAPPQIEKTTAALLALKEGLTDVDALFTIIEPDMRFSGSSINNLEDAINRLINPNLVDRANDFMGTVSSLGRRKGSGDSDAIIKQFDAIGDSLANLVTSGHGEQAAEIYAILYDRWTTAGGSIENLNGLMPTYQEALTGVANSQKLAAQNVKGLADGTTESGDAMGDAAEQTMSYRDALSTLYDLLAAQSNSYVAGREALRTLKTAQQEAHDQMTSNNTSIEDSTELMLANEAVIDSYGKTVFDSLGSLREMKDANGQAVFTTAELQDKVQTTRDEFIAFAEAQSLSSEAAAKLADNIGLIPEKFTTDYSDMDKFQEASAEVRAIINSFPEEVRTKLAAEDYSSATIATIEALLATGLPDQVIVEIMAREDATEVAEAVTAAITDGVPVEWITQMLAEDNASTGVLEPLSERIRRIPTEWTILLKATNKASSSIRAVNRMLNRIDGKVARVFTEHISLGGPIMAGYGGSTMATGGAIYGPGTGTSDSIPAWLSNGEHVLTARNVDNLGGQANVYRLRSMIDSGYLKHALGFASGGAVGQGIAVPIAANAQSVQHLTVSLEGGEISGRLEFDKSGIVRLVDGRLKAYDRVRG